MHPETSEVIVYWKQIIATLHQRGLLQKRPRQGGFALPEADSYLLPDRCLFVLNMQRLGGIPREKWLDAALWAQWRAALRGRRCFVSDGGGLGITVARNPGKEQRKRLPAIIPLDLSNLPSKPYVVILGYSKSALVTIDLAGEHRAILTGGTSGSGKTNFMQSVILQLATKHTPTEAQLAIIDTKLVDFGPRFERLPHLFASIAHDLEEAQTLIELVEAERLRRQTTMARAGVSDWRDLPEGEQLPLLLLIVDEAADFTRSSAMTTLTEVARKGRAFGISLIVGTQSPSSRVIDPQIRANLSTAIAFQTRTYIESQVILSRKGAENLNRPGLALTFLKGKWHKLQVPKVDATTAEAVATPNAQILNAVERALVRYAVEELNGAFTINALYNTFQNSVSRYALLKLAKSWERRGWLTEPGHNGNGHKTGRRVTPTLAKMALAGPGTPKSALVRPGTDGTMARKETTGVGGDTGEPPPFLDSVRAYEKRESREPRYPVTAIQGGENAN